MLVVISIIGILAALLMPALSAAKTKAKVAKAKVEIGQIVAAIHDYESAYSRFPVSSSALAVAGLPSGGDDFTYGTAGIDTSDPSHRINLSGGDPASIVVPTIT